MPSLFIKVINSTTVQATWEPSIKLGQHEGFKLYYRKVHLSQYIGPVLLPSNITAYNITHLGEYGHSVSVFPPHPGQTCPDGRARMCCTAARQEMLQLSPRVLGCFPSNRYLCAASGVEEVCFLNRHRSGR